MEPEYSPDHLDYILSTLDEAFDGKVKSAAEFLQIKPSVLLRLKRQRENEEKAERLRNVISSRPLPSAELVKAEQTEFAPAHDLRDWIKGNFFDSRSALYNKEHDHLREASIACLWTNVMQRKGGRRVLAQAELFGGSGNQWTKARVEWELKRLIGYSPDFLLTFDACALAEVPDIDFCAVVEHELYHCGQKFDMWDCPLFDNFGDPVWCIKRHDIEQFIGVVRRYGSTAAKVDDMVFAALMEPEIAPADIALACGTCRR